MVPRMACLENSWAESFGFPENSRQGTSICQENVLNAGRPDYAAGDDFVDDSLVQFGESGFNFRRA